MTHITKRLDDLKSRLSAAARAAGRSETEVSILAVSKRHNVASIEEAYSAGLHAMGENYVQEAVDKMAMLHLDIEWHFIGRIQSNKTRAIAEHFDWVQTVASEKVARRLAEQRPGHKGPLNVLVQVNIDGGDHGGVDPEGVNELCQFIARQPQLALRGLMTIPLPDTGSRTRRLAFARLSTLYDELCDTGFELDTLSMGMSADLEDAVAEGSTLVRIGTDLFGPRPD